MASIEHKSKQSCIAQYQLMFHLEYKKRHDFICISNFQDQVLLQVLRDLFLFPLSSKPHQLRLTSGWWKCFSTIEGKRLLKADLSVAWASLKNKEISYKLGQLALNLNCMVFRYCNKLTSKTKIFNVLFHKFSSYQRGHIGKIWNARCIQQKRQFPFNAPHFQ